MTTIETTDADAALKARQRAMWALGGYPTVAFDVIIELGPVLVEATGGCAAGTRCSTWAAGTCNAAVPAALAGADVVASLPPG